MVRSWARKTALFGFAAGLALNAACTRDASSPATPSVGSPLMSLAAEGGTPGSPFGTNAMELTEVEGSTPAGGSGMVSVIQTGKPGTNDFEMTVNVHGAPPDVDLYFQIRGDNGLPGGQQNDGICQRAATWPSPPVSVLNQVLHTSPGGSGALHLFFPTNSPFFEPGVTSDFMYRVVNFSRTFELRSACVSFTGK
jgi:hypothetical protein